MVSEELRALMRRFIDICKSKGFHKETVAALGTLAGSTQSHAVYGDTATAFKVLIELATKHDEEQILIDEFSKSVCRPDS